MPKRKGRTGFFGWLKSFSSKMKKTPRTHSRNGKTGVVFCSECGEYINITAYRWHVQNHKREKGRR